MKIITKNINKNSLKRLLLYRVSIIRLKKMGVTRVFSYTLGHETGVSPEQVRKDFSEYGIKGNQRGGYAIDELLLAMEAIFHGNKDHNIILVGMGNLGLALTKYSWNVLRTMNIVATFDIDPFKQKMKSEIPIYSMERLQEIIERFNIKVAIISVSEISAQEVCNELVQSGVKGIVNFAPVILKVPPEVFVNNVNLNDELERVIYNVHNLNTAALL